jgi:catechol 2,3-dioxygenase-like lactoylglutathione lyase family enzyme
MQLHYAGIRVTNLRRSLRFYANVLGLRVKLRGNLRKFGRGIWVGLEGPRTKAKLEFKWYPPGSLSPSKSTAGEALDHVGLVIGRASAKTLERESERPAHAGARPTPVSPTTTAGWMACVRDPDGNWVEIFRMRTAAELWSKRSRPERRSHTASVSSA